MYYSYLSRNTCTINVQQGLSIVGVQKVHRLIQLITRYVQLFIIFCRFSAQFPETEMHLVRHFSKSSLSVAEELLIFSIQPFVVPITFPTSKLPLCVGIWTPSNGSSGSPESTTQTASRSDHQLLQSSIVWQTDQPTDRQTDHAIASVTIGCIWIVVTSEIGLNNKLCNISRIYCLVWRQFDLLSTVF